MRTLFTVFAKEVIDEGKDIACHRPVDMGAAQ